MLAAVLLLLVALTLVAHGALYLARQELLVARISVRDVQARIAAESGVRRIQRSWPPDLDSLLVGAVRDLGGTVGPRASYRGRVRRLGEELFWVWARGEVTGWPGAREVARVLWRPDPARRLAGLAAAVETGAPGAVAPGASVSGAAVTAPPPGWDGICLPLDPRLAALYPLGSVPDLGVLPGGAGGGVAALGLGPVEAEGLLAAADLVVAGAPVPRPSAAGG
ncbi:MAG TPA: hypothetical protein VLL48_00115, partial [Longimicrobiales bacterium]|nr:hypothetical protein [Longimicrobiales bacterium]